MKSRHGVQPPDLHESPGVAAVPGLPVVRSDHQSWSGTVISTDQRNTLLSSEEKWSVVLWFIEPA